MNRKKEILIYSILLGVVSVAFIATIVFKCHQAKAAHSNADGNDSIVEVYTPEKSSIIAEMPSFSDAEWMGFEGNVKEVNESGHMLWSYYKFSPEGEIVEISFGENVEGMSESYYFEAGKLVSSEHYLYWGEDPNHVIYKYEYVSKGKGHDAIVAKSGYDNFIRAEIYYDDQGQIKSVVTGDTKYELSYTGTNAWYKGKHTTPQMVLAQCLQMISYSEVALVSAQDNKPTKYFNSGGKESEYMESTTTIKYY